MNTLRQYPWFVKGDIDGALGLFIDNILQLMLISVLCTTVCGMDAQLINRFIMPGAAISLIVGNLFYAWQARKVAIATGNPNTTALPYGINTTTVIAFTFLIMAPVYRETGNPALAWKAGIFACFISGIFETLGAFVGDWLRRNAPRAALLAALSGIAISFIAMGFVFQIFANPIVALAPAFLLFAIYISKVKLPWHIPGAIWTLILGTFLAWGSRWIGHPLFEPTQAPYHLAFYYPIPVVGDLLSFLIDGNGWKYMTVIIPMAIFSVLGSLENLVSAEAGGDHFQTRSSLLVNGLGSLIAALFGSPYPTTIYIGHPGWKQMGARYGYSILNGVVITGILLIGGVTLILKVIPIEALLGILLWIGIVMTSQSFQVCTKHSGAIVVAIIPSLASWLLVQINSVLQAAGTTLYDIADKLGSSLYIHGVIALSQGFIISSVILGAICVFATDKKYLQAALWSAAGTLLSFFGIIHAYQLTPAGVQDYYAICASPTFAIAYTILALCFIGLHLADKKTDQT